VLKIKPRLAARKIAGALFVVDIEKETLHEFNPTAAFIWELVEKRKDKNEIIEALCDCFEVSAAEAESDVETFFKVLETKDLAKRQ